MSTSRRPHVAKPMLLAATALVALAIAAAAPPAATAEYGYDVNTTINTASLFQCPHAVINRADLSCNQGVVVNGTPSKRPDKVTSLCRLADPRVKSPWGGEWRLVRNRANNHVGFLDRKFLVEPPGKNTIDRTDCRRAGHGVHATINKAPLFQWPHAAGKNRGQVANGLPSGRPNDVAAICRLNLATPRGGRWWLVLNHANNHVGYISSKLLKPQRGSFTPRTC